MTEEPLLPPGAIYVAGLIDLSMQDVLIEAVDQRPWIEDLKRRVQHYGYWYDYRARTITPDAYLGPLPQWASDLAGRLVGNGWFKKPGSVDRQRVSTRTGHLGACGLRALLWRRDRVDQPAFHM